MNEIQIPDNWTRTTLGNLLNVLTDYTANGSFEALKLNVKYYTEKNYSALVRTTDLEKKEFEPQRFTDKKGHEFQRKTALFGGEIVLANVGSVGKVYRVPFFQGPMTLAPNTYLVKFQNSFSNEFIFQFLKSEFYLAALFKNISSTTLAAINKDNFRSIEIDIPNDFNEQQKIAKILSTVDNLIEKTQTLIDKYTSIKQGMMADLFARGIDLSSGQLRPSVEDAPELYKETELGWVPKEWKIKSLGEFAEKITSGSRDWAAYYSDVGDLFVRISNLTREHINFRWDSIKYVDIGEGSEGERTLLEEGDILISITADLGIIGVVPNDFGRAFINQHTALVRITNNSINSRFVGQFLQSYAGKKQFEMLNDSGAKAGLNLPTVASLLCIQPTVQEQENISNRLDTVDQLIANYKAEKSKYISQKKGLMQDLLTGKVKVN